MTIESQVASLELCQKLKELGYPQESLFCWVPNPPSYVESYRLRSMAERGTYGRDVYISAPTVAELGEMLPWKIEKLWTSPNKTEIRDWYLDIYKHDFEKRVGDTNKWNVVYSSNQINFIHLADQTEANTRAKMVIYLLENKFVTL